MRRTLTLTLLALLATAGCGDEPGGMTCPGSPGCPPVDPCAEWGGVCPDPIQINEVMAKNDAAWIDNYGETDDWLELVNTGDAPVSLLGYTISDNPEIFQLLPGITLEPGEVVLFWADDERTQGMMHLPFRLSSRGEMLFLWSPEGRLVDRVSFPASQPNDSFARFPDGEGPLVHCRFASPDRHNGASCEPPPPTELPTEVTFADFTWPAPWPSAPEPLALTELGLRPASFIELLNTSAAAVDLSGYSLTLATHLPGDPLPGPTDGVLLSWPAASAAVGEYLTVAVDATAMAAIASTADYEGVVTLWDSTTGAVVDRIDFTAWPDGALLARADDSTGAWRFCQTGTPAAANGTCDPLASRPIAHTLRHLFTPGDFEALAEGGTAVGMAAAKFVIDMQGDDSVYLMRSADWDLHYTWVREIIESNAHLDRCDPTEAQAFRQGWVQFSQQEYFQVDTRRYLLGTLVRHAGSDLWTMEFATGDAISPAQMERAFFAVMHRVLEPANWALRPQSSEQVDRMRVIEGGVPIVDPNAPFRDVTLQLLTEGLAYGLLTFVRADALDEVALGPQVVVITDQVPNDIPLVGGLITETFQTPLAHVNVLSRNRGTPNMALRDARNDARLAPWLDTLVRFEVTPGGFTIEAADPAEAQAHWDSLGPGGPPLVPRLNPAARGLQLLADSDIWDLPALGAKAAQLAELGRVESTSAGCPGSVPVPMAGAALPIAHSLEHFTASGATALLSGFEADPLFQTDPRVRADNLAQVRDAILVHPVDVALVAEVEDYLLATFGLQRVRFRSSSNVEDLPGFNGAGLYTSVSAELGDPERRVDDALRAVWASLYNARAYDERRLANVDETAVGMGVLIHPAFLGERANAVAISRNILDPIRSDIYYLNAQVGEASVVNPAPGISTEQLIYRWGRDPRIIYFGQSNLPNGVPVLSDTEVGVATCLLRAIHNHFRPLLDPTFEDRWFAMDIELKLVGPAREWVVKQARPYAFGAAQIPADCREF